ncbi:MAG: hypothetical protein R6W91_01795 [Thermoplasmata archaeon]
MMGSDANYAPPPPPMPAPRERPLGVTILAVLYFVQGLGMILGGWLITSLFGSFFDILGSFGADMGSGNLLCLIPFVILALFYFLIGFGLLKGRSWARTIGILFAIIGLINVPIGTIISIIILIYLFKPEVKAYFGK